MEHRDRRLILIAIGLLLLLAGAVAAVLGPLEMYCFYLFAGDGPFAYEGFGFGSFMFGNLALQIMGYYCVAALALPLGYGHLSEIATRLRQFRNHEVTTPWYPALDTTPRRILPCKIRSLPLPA